MTDIRVDHGDDWMSITVSKRIVAIRPSLPVVQPLEERSVGIEPTFARHYRRAFRPSTDVMLAIHDEWLQNERDAEQDAINRMYS